MFVFAIVIGFFATLWVYLGTASLGSIWNLALTVCALITSVIIGGILIRTGKPCGPSREPSSRDKAIYWGAVAFEGVGIPVSISLLRQNGLDDYILPAMALIVGIHFFALIAAFHTRLYLWTGGVMCVLALLGIFLVPGRLTLGSHLIDPRALFVGIGCAVTLWVTQLYRARRA